MKPEISIEFFPPTTAEGADKLRATRDRLAALKPSFFSVTYGAGGSTRERTFATVKEIAAAGFEAAPHLSCIGSTRDSIREILQMYGEFRFALVGDDTQGDLPAYALAPEHVAQLSVDRRYHGHRQHVGSDDPGEVLKPAQLSDDRRQCGRDDRLRE